MKDEPRCEVREDEKRGRVGENLAALLALQELVEELPLKPVVALRATLPSVAPVDSLDV